MIERRTITSRKERLMEKWADASRHLRAEEAADLWRELMEEWLRPLVIDQNYFNALLDRKMAILERREQRSAVIDDEWDNTHQEMNQ